MNSEKDTFLIVGYVQDAHGIKGEVFVRLNAGKAEEWLSDLKIARFKRTARAKSTLKHSLEYKILRTREHKDGLVLQLEGMVDRNQAEALIGYEFEIPQNFLESEAGESIYLREVLGFQVTDAQLGELGPVLSFSSNGVQDLLVLERGGQEVLIPFIEPFITKMDFANKRIEMNLPEGLMETETKNSSALSKT